MSDETFDDFLAGEGLLEACEAQAIKELIAGQNLAATVKANAQVALPVMASEAKPSSAGARRRVRKTSSEDGASQP